MMIMSTKVNKLTVVICENLCLDILEDIKEECNKYGRVLSIEIPRPIEGIQVPGVGKVCIV